MRKRGITIDLIAIVSMIIVLCSVFGIYVRDYYHTGEWVPSTTDTSIKRSTSNTEVI